MDFNKETKTQKRIRKFLFKIKKVLNTVSCFEKDKNSDNTKIDVIIPTIEKDLKILELCIEGIKKNIQHKIDDIYVVSPNSELIKNMCEKLSCVFVEEGTVFDFTPKDINYYAESINRSGWIFQQLIKLSGVIGTNENFLVVDADTVILRKIKFIYKNMPIFYESSERHYPYYRFYRKLFGKKKVNLFSFVSHMMLFNKSYLQKMKNEVEKKFGIKWYDAILQNLDKNEKSCFSEYETYANWVCNNYKAKKCVNFNRSLIFSDNIDYKFLYNKFSEKYKSVSFHDWISKQN